MIDSKLKIYLDKKVKLYNNIQFIENDPIVIPHQFSKKQDIEIAGLFAAVFAWGQRVTIINKSNELLQRMDGKPYDFILNHSENDLKQLIGFKHRTFNDTDLLYFIHFLHSWYKSNNSLESAFLNGIKKNDQTTENGLTFFRNHFFSSELAPARTKKHIPSPLQHSACKRLNMYLRWMVRKDKQGVDFGIWTGIKPHQLICPLDVHVQKIALQLGLLSREKADWQAASELTNNLRKLDPADPVKYDFALFGTGINESF